MEKPEYLQWLNQYTDAEACTLAQQNLPYYIRVNTLKTTKEEYLNWTKLKLKPTFLENTFQVLELPEKGLGNTIDYATGWMHTQSLSSMLPPHILNPKPGEQVLDICAAPGSKTTQCAALMQNKGVILANDKNKGRISALANNLERLGVINTTTMNQDGARFTSQHKFSKILVDAPCSGLGSNEKAHEWWDEKYSRNISALQSAILRPAFSHLEEGGTLVYSTCTYSPNENETPVSRLLEKNPEAKLEKVEIPNSEPGLADFGIEFKKARRIYPHKFNSEGFFIAKIKKS
ncbi:MAG: RsmB/NOP family class I SAM-dependent RNA methyltransferase [bacterium]|nr:RsmB/NOP family class I SAM-dependent RNA methyltransferase [bacterium]